MDSLRPNFALHHLIGDPDVSKSTSSHDEIIASASTISVEIFLLNSSFLEESSSRRRCRNVTSWRNVVCSYGITKNC